MSPLGFVNLIIAVFTLVAAIAFKLTTFLFEILRLSIWHYSSNSSGNCGGMYCDKNEE